MRAHIDLVSYGDVLVMEVAFVLALSWRFDSFHGFTRRYVLM